jgi:hypothetical protein
MKKYTNFLLASSVILFVTSAYLAYRLSVVTNTLQAKKPFFTNCSSLKYDYSNSPWTGKIDVRLAKVMADNYKEDSQKSLISVNNKITPDSDARSAWFPLESLKSYIWDIENQNCLNSNCHKEVLGLRIYFAKYPDLSSRDWLALGLSGLKTTYANRHTIFMIPTYSYGDNNIDFNPWSSDCSKPVFNDNTFNPADTLNQTRARWVFFADQVITGSEGKNHGTLIPPGDATGSSFQ